MSAPIVWRPLLALALVVAASGCLAPPPRFVKECQFGVVRADHPDTLQRFRTLVEELYPRVVESVPASVPRPCDLWAQNRLRYYRFSSTTDGHHGFTVIDSDPARIHVRADSPFPDWIVAHELVHATLGDAWAPLPAVVEEGLCDVIACQLCPHRAGQIRMRRMTGALGYLGKYALYYQYDTPFGADPQLRGLQATHSVRFSISYQRNEKSVLEALQLPALPGDTDVGAEYGIGYVIASRIVARHGIGALLEMCQRARVEGLELVPAEWLLRAAELPEDIASWPLAEILDFDEPELRALALQKRDELIPLLRRTLQEIPGDHSAGEKFRAASPRLVTSDGARVSFLDLPQLLHAAAP